MPYLPPGTETEARAFPALPRTSSMQRNDPPRKIRTSGSFLKALAQDPGTHAQHPPSSPLADAADHVADAARRAMAASTPDDVFVGLLQDLPDDAPLPVGEHLDRSPVGIVDYGRALSEMESAGLVHLDPSRTEVSLTPLGRSLRDAV